MADKRPGVVSLRGGHTWTHWHSCHTAARTFAQMATESKTAIKGMALPTVRLGPKARRAQDSPLPPGKKKGKKKGGEEKWFDKALAAELHLATILTCLDSPEKVFAPCELARGRPTRHAGAGEADAWAAYPGFAILVEVSTKVSIYRNDFRKQMMQAVRHGMKLSGKLDRPVYALVVNNRDIETQMPFRAIYRKACRKAVKLCKKKTAKRAKKKTTTKCCDVRPIALFNLSLVLVLDAISAIDAEDFQFDASRLQQALQALYDGLATDETKGLTGGWSANTVIEKLRVRQESLPGMPS